MGRRSNGEGVGIVGERKYHMKRCGVYVRSATGDGTALAMQETEGIKLCRRNGWRHQMFREVGLPGAALRKLLKLVKGGKLDYVFAWRFDRLSRNIRQLITIVEEIERSGAEIITAAGPIRPVSTSRMSLYELLRDAVAEHESLVRWKGCCCRCSRRSQR